MFPTDKKEIMKVVSELKPGSGSDIINAVVI